MWPTVMLLPIAMMMAFAGGIANQFELAKWRLADMARDQAEVLVRDLDGA